MSTLPMSVQEIVNARMVKRFGDKLYALDLDKTEEEVQRLVLTDEMETATRAAELVEALGKLAMGGGRAYLLQALKVEHPTILGQIMGTVSMAVAPMGDSLSTYCDIRTTIQHLHITHDGRLTCETVIGATLARHQPLI